MCGQRETTWKENQTHLEVVWNLTPLFYICDPSPAPDVRGVTCNVTCDDNVKPRVTGVHQSSSAESMLVLTDDMEDGTENISPSVLLRDLTAQLFWKARWWISTLGSCITGVADGYVVATAALAGRLVMSPDAQIWFDYLQKTEQTVFKIWFEFKSDSPTVEGPLQRDAANMLMCWRQNVYHLHHLGLVC